MSKVKRSDLTVVIEKESKENWTFFAIGVKNNSSLDIVLKD